jgi:hypothetical protein
MLAVLHKLGLEDLQRFGGSTEALALSAPRVPSA